MTIIFIHTFSQNTKNRLIKNMTFMPHWTAMNPFMSTLSGHKLLQTEVIALRVERSKNRGSQLFVTQSPLLTVEKFPRNAFPNK